MSIVVRPFAYNTGAPIAGTIQVGDLAVGTPTSGFTNSPTFWNGPDETQGYVIAYPVSGGTHPTPIPGVFAYLGFLGTKNMSNPLSESTFIALTNSSFNQSFTTGNDASTWLTNNGYWNSWVSITPTPTATLGLTPTPTITNTATPTGTPSVTSTPTPSVTNTLTPTGTPSVTSTPTPSVTTTLTPTNTLTPTPTPTSAATPSGFSVTIVESGGNVVMSASGSLNINDLTFITTTTLGGSGLGVNTATFIMGTNGSFSTYSGFTSTPTSFGTGTGYSADSASGDIFGVIYQGTPPYQLAVPAGYTTGTVISSTQTFTGQTLSSLGLVEGTYTYTWGSGANADSINVVVGGGGVTPTPTATSQTPTPTPTSGASGNFNVTVSQVGPDVVWNGSGSFNLSALSFIGNPNIGAGYQANQAIWAIGPNVTIDQYQGTITYPSTFGAGGTPVTTTSGSTFGILPGGSGRTLYVPAGYTSNTTISGSATYANTTISGMGLTSGVYTWSWGSGGNTSTLIMTISS
jgi:hypothetical protein